MDSSSLKRSLKFPFRIVDQLTFDCGFDVEDTIVISGSPRSGTTWLMELLQQLPGYTTLFEPFHHKWFPETEKRGFSLRPYIPQGQGDEAMEEYLEDVFSGCVCSKNPQYRFSLDNTWKRLKADKLVVKFVRANRLIPWMLERFNVRAIVYMVRHPCATIASQLRTSYTGYDIYKVVPDREEILFDAEKIGLDSETMYQIKDLKSDEELLAAAWAMDQIVPLRDNKSKIYLLSYESLFKNNEKELKKILSFLEEMEYYEKMLSKINRPSIVSGDLMDDGIKSKLSSWKKELSEEQIEKIRKTLVKFSIYFDEEKYCIMNFQF